MKAGGFLPCAPLSLPARLLRLQCRSGQGEPVKGMRTNAPDFE